MVFQKWQFWALVGLFILDIVIIGLPVGSLILLVAAFARGLRLWAIDFLLSFEDDKYATLNEVYGAEEQPRRR